MSLLCKYSLLLTVLGSERLSYFESHRLVVAFFWLYVIIIRATYSGNLVAFLSTEKTDFPFNTLDEMVKQDEYTFGTLGSTLFVEMLKVKINCQLFQKYPTQLHNYICMLI